MEKGQQDHDIGWIKKAARGDRKACRRLIEDHKRLVGHIVYRMCGQRADFEDLCQDIFLKVFNNLHTFEYQSKLSTWIAKIAHNHCINALRKRKVALFDDHTPDDLTLDSLAGDCETPQDITEKIETQHQIEKAIAALPETMRTAVTLFYIEQLSHAEMVEIMGLPENTVKSHLFRARKQLKTALINSVFVEEDILS